MQEALDASRECYGQWFGTYPWRDLRLTEFPGLAGYAQGFPGNITFSESIGFLTRPGGENEVDLVFYVTAHEAGHQWWGNMLMPGKGLGGNILSEGLANYSALLLTLEKRGDDQRQRMLRQWEDDYVNGRSADSERPMVLISGTRPGDQTVTYDKAGWVFWMMTRVLGREAMLAGLREFIQTYANGPDYPLLQDLLVVMRRHATDLPAFDAFARQWFEQVVLPEFKLWDLKVTKPDPETWVVEGTLENVGTGMVTVEVGVEGRVPELAKDAPNDAKPEKAPRARTTVAIGPETRIPFRITCPFEPVKAIVDPDVQMLQVRRKLAEVTLPRS
jgi:hypothetical protein